MCNQCVQLDAKIERRQKLCDPLTDPITRERLTRLLEDLKAERSKLHPSNEK